MYVSIPESSGRTLIHLEPGADGATELGESGVYTVYVMADEIVTNALKKVRDVGAALGAAKATVKSVASLSARTGRPLPYGARRPYGSHRTKTRQFYSARRTAG